MPYRPKSMHIFLKINGYTKNHGGKRYLTIISADEKDKYMLKKIYRKNISDKITYLTKTIYTDDYDDKYLIKN